MISAKLILVLCTTHAFLIYISQAKEAWVPKSVSICSAILKKSAADPNCILEEYERFLAVMFRNTSNFGQDISASSSFQENPNYFASSDILDTADFFVKTIPYLVHQYDEQDLILLADNFSEREKIQVFRNSKLTIESGLCHKLQFMQGYVPIFIGTFILIWFCFRFSGEMDLVINLELYDSIDESDNKSWLEYPLTSSSAPKVEYLIPGMHLTMGKNQQMKPINLTSLLVLKTQGSPLQKYFNRVCNSIFKKQLLHKKYPQLCKIPTDTSQYFRLADEYIQQNVVIVSLRGYS